MPTIKELKAALLTNNATWSVHERLLNQMELPKFHTGALKDKLIPTARVESIDFRRLFSVQPNNPLILECRITLGIVSQTIVPKKFRAGSAPVLTPGVGGASSMRRHSWKHRPTYSELILNPQNYEIFTLYLVKPSGNYPRSLFCDSGKRSRSA